jgi:hypothetical protein
MLSGRDTFRIAQGTPDVYRSESLLSQLKGLPEDGAPQITGELVIRGLRFFSQNGEIFPPAVPFGN